MPKDRLIAHVKEFLRSQLPLGAPVLLAFSGGGDSLALLHLLLECKKAFPFTLHLAHVDHGWRKESAQEAKELRKLAEKLGLPFHATQLAPAKGGNLEAKAREARYAFFQKLYAELGCQALLLAHQADDQAETILKRVLEGSHFLALGGMQKQSTLYGMRLLRPLLECPKKTLEAWLTKRGEKGFQDPTNRDPAFLRARLRTQILPELARQFGKEISSNLLRLGKTFDRLGELVEVGEELANTHRNAGEVALIVPSSLPNLKRSALVKRFLQQEEFFLSYESFEAVCSLLEQQKSRRAFLSKEKKLIVDRGKLIIQN